MKDQTARTLEVAALVVTALAAVGTFLLSNGFGSLLPRRNHSETQDTASKSGEIPPDPRNVPQPTRADSLQRTNGNPAQHSPTEPSKADLKQKRPDNSENQTLIFADKEQKTIVPGCASLAVEFNEISRVEVLTVRLNVGDESTLHAVLGAGERFKFSCGREDYLVSILLIEHEARTAHVGLERLSSEAGTRYLRRKNSQE
jgi:hypothetical protein